jgi:adenylylsulfate kinase
MQGVTVWFTGLSGAGKTTLSQAVEKQLTDLGYPVERLDGDIVRRYLSKGLGFSKTDRDENIRRIGFVAHLLSRHGVIVLAAAISPYRAIRDEVRQLHTEGSRCRFVEVFVNAPLAVCESRDVKGLYQRARLGEISHFTGISDPYEPPLAPEVECRTDLEPLEESVARVMQALRRTYGLQPHLGSIPSVDS